MAMSPKSTTRNTVNVSRSTVRPGSSRRPRQRLGSPPNSGRITTKCSRGSATVRRRSTTSERERSFSLLMELVCREVRVQYFARALGAGHGKPLGVDHTELHQHRGLVPVDVLMGDLTS